MINLRFLLRFFVNWAPDEQSPTNLPFIRWRYSRIASTTMAVYGSNLVELNPSVYNIVPSCVADVTVDCALCRQSNKRTLLLLLLSRARIDQWYIQHTQVGLLAKCNSTNKLLTLKNCNISGAKIVHIWSQLVKLVKFVTLLTHYYFPRFSNENRKQLKRQKQTRFIAETISWDATANGGIMSQWVKECNQHINHPTQSLTQTHKIHCNPAARLHSLYNRSSKLRGRIPPRGQLQGFRGMGP